MHKHSSWFGILLLFLILSPIFLSHDYSTSTTSPRGAEDKVTLKSSASTVTKVWTNYNSMKCVSLSANGSYIAAAATFHLYFFNNTNNNSMWEYDSGSKNFYSLALSENAQYVACGFTDGTLMLFNTSKTNPKIPIWTYDIGDGAIRKIAISANGSYIAAVSASSDHSAYLFNSTKPVGAKEYLWRYNLGVQTRGLDITNNGTVVVGSTDNNVYLFNSSYSASKVPIWSYTAPMDVNSVSISEDGYYIAVGAGNNDAYGSVYLLNSTFTAPKSYIWNHTTAVNIIAVEISNDGSTIVAGSDYWFGTGDSSVYCFTTSNHEPLWKYTEHTGIWYFEDISITEDGAYILAGDYYDTSVLLFDNIASVAKTPLWRSVGSVSDIDMSLDGKYFAIIQAPTYNLTLYKHGFGNGITKFPGAGDDDDDGEDNVNDTGVIVLIVIIIIVCVGGVVVVIIVLIKKGIIDITKLKRG